MVSDVIWKTMKVSMLQITLALVLTGMVAANDNYAQKILDREVNLQLKAVTLKKVLQQIEVNTGVRFVYSGSYLKLDDIVSINARSKKLGILLDELLTPRDIEFRVQDNNAYIILMREDPTGALNNGLQRAGIIDGPVEIPITGKVTDRNGMPVPGVNIIIKGTSMGTVTDADGVYRIDAPDANAILVFSSIGYVTREVAVTGSTVINVTLEEETRALDEVVVTALGIQREAKRLGYATSTVDTEQLSTNRTTNG